MVAATGHWGDEIAVQVVNGIPYRMYVERPHRIDELLALGERWGDRPYLVQADTALSFAGMLAAVAAKAAGLRAAGVRPGHRVFVLGWNSPEWVVNFWACLAAGAVPVLANTWWSAAELARGIAALDPFLILADPSAAAKAPDGTRLGDWGLPPAGAAAAPPPDATPGDEEETALVIFTSGTSGDPKAVVLSHRAVLARLQTTLHVTRRLPHQVDDAKGEVTLLTGPLFHVGSMQTLLRAMVVGETLVLSRGRFDPAEILALIERHKVRRWIAVPTMVSRLLDHPDVSRRDVSSLKSISIGGAPVHAELMRRMRTGLPSVSPRVPTGYGLTENGGQATAAAGSEDVARLGSTGRPMPCVEIRLAPVPGFPDGEVLLRSPTQMSGYHGLAESPIDAEGWLHTGDLGRIDEAGNLWITGRSKDMIIRGGENIAPVAVERALMTVPGVTEAVVFGVPHPDLGEEVMAVVVVDPARADGPLTEAALAAGLRTRVSSFAMPTRWRVQHAPLATNHTGKVDKPAISRLMREELAREGSAREALERAGD